MEAVYEVDSAVWSAAPTSFRDELSITRTTHPPPPPDPVGVFVLSMWLHLAPLESEIRRFLLSARGIPWGDTDGVVLVADGRAYQRSTAVSRVARYLGFPCVDPGLGPAAHPEPSARSGLRHPARNRYRFDGTVESCLVPDPTWAGLVLG